MDQFSIPYSTDNTLPGGPAGRPSVRPRNCARCAQCPTEVPAPAFLYRQLTTEARARVRWVWHRFPHPSSHCPQGPGGSVDLPSPALFRPSQLTQLRTPYSTSATRHGLWIIFRFMTVALSWHIYMLLFSTWDFLNVHSFYFLQFRKIKPRTGKP